jgi:uncharacterized delta-60 repeat protein
MAKHWVRRAVATVATVASVVGFLAAPAASAAPAPAGAAGSFDTTFGSGGVATVTVAGTTLSAMTKVVVQPDGKLLVGGLQPGTTNSVTVARLNSNGTIDTTFGAPNGWVKPGMGSASPQDGAQIGLQPDGKILVAGSKVVSGVAKVALTRLNTNGSIDTSFGTSGTGSFGFGSSIPAQHGSSVSVLANGQILVGVWLGPGHDALKVIRFSSAGVFDTSFGTSGLAISRPVPGNPAQASDMVVQPDGKIVEVGSVTVTHNGVTQNDTAVARFTSAGQPDTTFPSTSPNSQGAVVIDMNTTKSDAATSVTLDAAGRINITGTISSTPSNAYVLRLSSSGAIDSTFGTAGVLKGTFGGVNATGGGATFDGSGRLLVAGGDGAASTTALGIERLLSSGATPYDSSFGLSSTPGRETIDCPTGQTGAGTAVSVQTNQQILLAGNCNGALKVARLNAGNLTNLTMTATSPNAASGHPAVPLASIPSNVLTASAGALAGSDLRDSAIFGAPFGHGPFGHGPFGHGPFGHGPFGHGPFGHGPFGHGPFGHGPFGHGSVPQLNISDIPLQAPKTWDQVLAGTPCATLPQQSLTLDYVNANCNTAALQALVLDDIQINSTPLRNISLSAFALGFTPVANIPGACSASQIQSQPQNCSNNDPSTTSLMDLELAGDNLSAYYAAATINLNGLALVQAPISDVWLTDVSLADTSLGPILVSSLHTPGTFVSCGSGCPAGQTLAQSQANGQIVASSASTIAGLLADSPSAVGPLPLSNVLVGLLPKQSLPVEQLPIDGIVASSPLPSNGTAGYKVDFDLGCGASAGLTVRPTLPTGFRTVPSTVTMTVGGTSKPVTVASDGSITPQTPISCSGVQHVTVNLQAEPTTTLGGPLLSSVTVNNTAETISATNQAPVTIVDPTDSSAAASTPPGTPGSTDTMYVDHIGRPGNVDYFTLAPQTPGSAVIITLSHIPAGQDYDLVLYGPQPSSLRGAPFGHGPFGHGPFGHGPFGHGALLAGDDALSPASDGTIIAPELLQDVPLLPDQAVRSASAQRGSTDEAVYTLTTEEDTTPFTIQVSGFNGSSSPQPYVLRVTVIPPSSSLPCAARTLPNIGVQGTLPSSLSPTTRTLILVNQKRLGDLYGVTAANNVMAKLNALASYTDPSNSEFDVRGAVLPIDGDSTVASDYQAWDNSPCSVKAANQIVADTNKVVDRLRGGLNDLRYVVVIGSDEVVPFGRVPDTSAKANEAGAGSDVVQRGNDNPTSASLSAGYIMSDNPYGDVDPSAFGATPFYVPQLAVGRLVETPTDITTAIDQYVSSGGVRTPTASYNAAYDWMTSTGQAVNSALSPRVPAGSATSQFNNTWTRQDAKNGLQTAAHGFVSINAHSNYSQQLPASEFTSKTATPDVLSTADLPADLQNGVLLTLGCHTGLNVSDTYIANPNSAEQATLLDWSEAVLRNGGVLQAPTGYGIGDTEVLAYSGRLLGMYAQKLDGSSSIGQALMLAKQQYVQLGVASVYDAKAIEEATFYGLPMYRLGASGRVAPSTLPVLTNTPPSQSLSATSTQNFNSAPVLGPPDPRGSYYVVGSEAPQVTPNEPIEPRTVANLTPPQAGVVAHDAVIEQMTTQDHLGFNPIYSATSAGGAVPEPQVSVAAFPSQLHQVVATVGPNGAGQSLVFIPGQFSSDGSSAGTGNQRIVTSATLTVNWSNSSDFDPPAISSVSGSINGTTATFHVVTTATDATRGVLLFLPTAGNPNTQGWTHVELVNSGGGSWTGTATLPSGTNQIGQFFVSLCDAAGNCGHSSNKARNYSASTAINTFNFSIAAPGAGPNGLYPDPTNVTVNGPSGTTFTVKIDGANARSCTTSCTVTVTGDGAHDVKAIAADGTTADAAVPMAHPPIVTVAAPTANGRYRQGQTAATSFSCSSNVTLVSCTGPSTVDTVDTGNHTATFVGTDQFGQQTVVNVPYYVDGTPPTLVFNQTPPVITKSGSATLSFSGTDPDEPSYTVTFTCQLDSAAPAPCTSPTTVQVPAPIDGTHTFSVVASDRVGNTTKDGFTWRIDTTAPVFKTFGGPADPSDDQTQLSMAWSAEDPPDTAALTFVCTLDGQPAPCNSTGAQLGTLTKRVAPYVFAVTATDPAGNQTTDTYSFHVYERTAMIAAPVVPGVTRLTATLSESVSGNGISGQKVLFSRGHSPGGITVTCIGTTDGQATTDGQGVATCNISTSDLLIVGPGGFTATFALTPPYFGSSDDASLAGT